MCINVKDRVNEIFYKFFYKATGSTTTAAAALFQRVHLP